MTSKKAVYIGRRNMQAGYLLLPVAVAIALIGVIAFLVSGESAFEVDMTANELDTARAEYVAQAGLQHALRHHAQQGCGPYTDLVDYPFAGAEYDTKLSHDLGGTAAYTVNVDQDTWIRDDFPTNNYAADSKMHIRNEAGVIERPLLRYDLSAIPAKAAILSARAWFYVDKEHPEGPVDIRSITADWTDTDATWDSMGDNLDAAVLASIPAQPAAGQWVPVNLTGQVQAWINGEANFGITIGSVADGVHAEYLSRESSFAPYLEVIVGTPPTSPARLASSSKLDGGAAVSVERDDVILRQSPVSERLLQPGPADARDTYLYEWKPTWNFGVSNDIWVDERFADSTAHGLIRFDLGSIPAGARVTGARLELYRVNPSLGGGPIGVYAIGAGWDEGANSGGIGESSWNRRDATNAWANSGGDFGSRRYALETVPAGTGWSAWEIGDLVDAWVSGAFPNQGLALLPGTAGTAAHFASSDATDPTMWPKLTVTYTCACGEVCIAPQGSGNILMVVINPTTLVAEDQKAKDLFESWGYTVSVISESANQTSYDAAVAANDVVFISETVNSTQVGTRLNSAPIGVVSQDGDYNPDLGLATGAALKVGGDIDIVSNDHFITQPFAAGSLRIYAADMEQAIVGGSLTGEQQILAEIGGDGSLVALDRGDAMEGGGNAAGPRVILPLGTRYRFDWDYLNNNGRLLVQRALEWGKGKACNAQTASWQVVAGNDDAEERGDSSMYLDSSDLELTQDGGNPPQTIGIRFQDIGLPPGTEITEAYLDFTVDEPDSGGTSVVIQGELSADAAQYDASSGNISSRPRTAASVTWDNIPVWNTAGDLHSTPDLAPLVQEIVDGAGWSAGNALAFVITGSGERTAESFDGSPTQSPVLRVSFCGSLVTGNPLLMVVPDPSSLGPADAAKKALFESWNYVVNLIDDDAPLADFQNASLVNDVAYVSATAVASSVGSKLFEAGVGVVNANSGLHDDFGFSTVRYITSTNAPMNTVASHYITQPFVGGTVTLYTSDQLSGGAVGTLAADLDQIGMWSSGGLSPLGGLVTLEAGAMTSIGENTPGRRAQMPWDNLDVSALSGDGVTILQRSLEWAGGAEIDLGPIAHWKLDETVGPTAVDSEGGHDGTWTNGPVPAPGVVDGALDFDGNNDYVDAGSFDVVGSGITMMGWFNAEALTTADERIISKADGTAEAEAWWQLSSSSSGADPFLRMRVKAGGTTTTLADSSTSLTTGEWHFAVATYDNASGEMKLYLDGVEVASRAHAVGGALDVDPSVPVMLGANGTAERFFDGILDDVRVYDRALGATEIQDLYTASAPTVTGYTERYESWSANDDDVWETADLAAYGVPANAVVEVAIINNDGGAQRWGGARAVGSTLDRRIQLHEAESGGMDVVTLHVQADASGRIEHFSDDTNDINFTLLGYWTGARYVELMEPFSADAGNSWVVEDVSDDGLGANLVAEVLIVNTDSGNERLAGVRAVGSANQRRFNLHEAESGGVDAYSLMVNTNAAAEIEVYAENAGDIDYYVVGYWDTPPGTYVENGTGQWTPSSNNWETVDLTAAGVPAEAIVQVTFGNFDPSNELLVGVRSVGSALERRLDLHKAEAGGTERATMHVNVDTASSIESYSEVSGATTRFAPVGWWVLSP